MRPAGLWMISWFMMMKTRTVLPDFLVLHAWFWCNIWEFKWGIFTKVWTERLSPDRITSRISAPFVMWIVSTPHWFGLSRNYTQPCLHNTETSRRTGFHCLLSQVVTHLSGTPASETEHDPWTEGTDHQRRDRACGSGIPKPPPSRAEPSLPLKQSSEQNRVGQTPVYDWTRRLEVSTVCRVPNLLNHSMRAQTAA